MSHSSICLLLPILASFVMPLYQRFNLYKHTNCKFNLELIQISISEHFINNKKACLGQRTRLCICILGISSEEQPVFKSSNSSDQVNTRSRRACSVSFILLLRLGFDMLSSTTESHFLLGHQITSTGSCLLDYCKLQSFQTYCTLSCCQAVQIWQPKPSIVYM